MILRWIPLWAFVLLTISRTPLATAQQTDLDIDDEGGGGLDGLEDEQELALQEEKRKNVVKDVRVSCNSEDITLTISTWLDSFNGLVYPKGLSKNSTCMTEYIQEESTIVYVLTLRSCNTMSTDVNDGVEYFNTIVVQPHRKLVTNQGRGYHIRCRYRTESKTLKSDFDVKFEWADQDLDAGADTRVGEGDELSGLGHTPLTATAAMPAAHMKIYRGEPVDNRIAENVKIGDPLTLVVSIDNQNIYGMHISECMVKDGLGWSEQRLINGEGCPVEYEIMGEFEYSSSKTTALVHFQAHKFPYTSSVYYQCNVRLCIRHAGGCDDVPPVCDASGENTLRRRRKRQTIEIDDSDGELYDPDREELRVKVYSGLYVNEATDLDDDLGAGAGDDYADEIHSVYDPSTICFPQRDFAIGIAVAGLILMLIVICAILCLLSKRRRRKDLSTTGSSIYSGPYTNTAYSSHSS